jgi:hypothetical protein
MCGTEIYCVSKNDTLEKSVFDSADIFIDYRKTCILASIFLQAFINIFIQVIFPNIICIKLLKRIKIV